MRYIIDCQTKGKKYLIRRLARLKATILSWCPFFRQAEAVFKLGFAAAQSKALAR